MIGFVNIVKKSAIALAAVFVVSLGHLERSHAFNLPVLGASIAANEAAMAAAYAQIQSMPAGSKARSDAARAMYQLLQTAMSEGRLSVQFAQYGYVASGLLNVMAAFSVGYAIGTIVYDNSSWLQNGGLDPVFDFFSGSGGGGWYQVGVTPGAVSYVDGPVTTLSEGSCAYYNDCGSEDGDSSDSSDSSDASAMMQGWWDDVYDDGYGEMERRRRDPRHWFEYDSF